MEGRTISLSVDWVSNGSYASSCCNVFVCSASHFRDDVLARADSLAGRLCLKRLGEKRDADDCFLDDADDCFFCFCLRFDLTGDKLKALCFGKNLEP